MKGLLIKDLQLLKSQKASYFPGLVVGIVFIVSGSNTSFAVMYLTLLFSTITYSTINFDLSSNGMSYLLTLPVSRSIYVKEKYFLHLLNTALCILLSVSITAAGFLFGSAPVQGDVLMTAALSALTFSVLMQSFMIPLLLRFGAEKSRTAVMVFLGLVYLIGFSAWILIRKFDVDLSSAIHLVEIQDISTAAFTTCTCAAMLILMAVSFLLSLRIMKKKEF